MSPDTPPSPPDLLRVAVDRVVEGNLCTGCGACASISPRIAMQIDADGYLRPAMAADSFDPHGLASEEHVVDQFKQVCVGREISAPPADKARVHPVLGRYLCIWSGHALDPEIRHAGSSGGVITALTTWLIATGEISHSNGVVKEPSPGTRSVSVRLTTRKEALEAAGSRYAPVGAAADYDASASNAAFVAKPCEIAAACVIDAKHEIQKTVPLKIGFFCAGTPSQDATDLLVSSHGLPVAEVESLSYRGDGWPGRFRARNADGSKTVSLTYADSWGKHLGPSVQPRCKVCPDGTGEWADISVGDYWKTDAAGYPVFDAEDAGGSSAVIARTPRGLDLLTRATAAGILELHEVTAEQVASRQPLQATRRITLAGRLLGLVLAGKPFPATKRFRLMRLALIHPLLTARYAKGMWTRARLI